MNKVAAALNAAWALVQTVAAAQGAEAVRNRLAAIDAAEATDLQPGSDHPYRLVIEFVDAPPTTVGVTLGPTSYDLLVQPTVAVIVIGDPSDAVTLTSQFADALETALNADRTLGGAVGWAEIADNPDDAEAYEQGAQGFADLLSLALSIPDARSARG